ncbi:MAG: hypothetical protein BGO67_09415 [Alphaproteobacteria bacterium 41-28]|nr:MAG: hypothetical protein BGO67_09415 [Alphaproteobacteria bacterium 41-28]
MKKYQKLLFILCLPFLPTSAEAMDPADGEYKIFCHTKNRGKRYLEAFPREGNGKVRPRPESLSQDQNWSIETRNNYRRISCRTRNGGIRYLEAFPKDKVARPKPQSYSQDQDWFIIPVSNGYYRIGCHTKNGGTRYLEAFPKAEDDKGVVRPSIESYTPKTKSYNPDQLWKLEKINNN